VAGGIYTHEDIKYFLSLGADAVQMGTRFLVTEESSATREYKEAVVKARKDDIIIAGTPGSPCGLPFRVLKHSPMYRDALEKGRPPRCDKGYVLFRDDKGRFTRCLAKESNESHFCICNGLLSSAGYNPDEEKPLYTVGSNAYRVDRIMTVSELMDELKGVKKPVESVA